MYYQFRKKMGGMGCATAHDCGGYANEGFSPSAPFWGRGKRPKFNVPINIVETENEYQVQVFAPSFQKGDTAISVVDDVLYIKGDKNIDAKSLPTFSHQEFPVKSFERTLNLGGNVDVEFISARNEEGVLTVFLPKSLKAKSQTKTIKVE